jgi:hypothetical protein
MKKKHDSWQLSRSSSASWKQTNKRKKKPFKTTNLIKQELSRFSDQLSFD